MKTSTPGNFMAATPSIWVGTPPRTAQNFLAASTSGTIVYHCPSETPDSFGAYSCAQEAVRGQRTVNTTMQPSLFINRSFSLETRMNQNRFRPSVNSIEVPQGSVSSALAKLLWRDLLYG